MERLKDSHKQQFIDGLKERSKTERSLIPTLGILMHPYNTGGYVMADIDDLEDDQMAAKCSVIVLKFPHPLDVTKHFANKDLFGVEEMRKYAESGQSNQYMIHIWCNHVSILDKQKENLVNRKPCGLVSGEISYLFYNTPEINDWVIKISGQIPALVTVNFYLTVGTNAPVSSIDPVRKNALLEKYEIKPITMEQWESTVQYWYPKRRRDFLKHTVIFGCNYCALSKFSNGEKENIVNGRKKEQNVVGFVAHTLSGQIGALEVLPEHQKQGLGTYLFERMYKDAKSSNAPLFACVRECDKERSFPVRQGFEMVNDYCCQLIVFNEEHVR